MKTLFRVLGAVAAVAVTGAAIVVLDKVLNDKDPLHVENVEFPEEAEKDPAEAEKTAEAYAEGEAKETAPGDAWPPAFEKGSCRARDCARRPGGRSCPGRGDCRGKACGRGNDRESCGGRPCRCPQG